MSAKFNMRAVNVARIAAGVLVTAAASAAVASADAQGSPQTGQAATTAVPSTISASSDADAHSTKVRFAFSRHARTAVTGHRIAIPGHLVAKTESGEAKASVAGATADVKITVQARLHRRWRTVATTRTGAHGGFKARFRVEQPGRIALRVRAARSHVTVARSASVSRAVAASATTVRAVANDGSVQALTPVVASWYYDAGDTACGFHATYGIANKTLPCGTKVSISYGGRTVVATVDDRGPYVYGRDYDLNQTTAEALDMYGVATVYASQA